MPPVGLQTMRIVSCYFLGYPDRLPRPVAGVGGDRRRRGALQAGGAPHPRQPGAHGGLAPLQGERLRQEQGQKRAHKSSIENLKLYTGTVNVRSFLYLH